MLFCKTCSLRNAVGQGDELTHSCLPSAAALTVPQRAQRCASRERQTHRKWMREIRQELLILAVSGPANNLLQSYPPPLHTKNSYEAPRPQHASLFSVRKTHPLRAAG